MLLHPAQVRVMVMPAWKIAAGVQGKGLYGQVLHDIDGMDFLGIQGRDVQPTAP